MYTHVDIANGRTGQGATAFARDNGRTDGRRKYYARVCTVAVA